MRTPTRIAGYLLGLGVVAVAATGVGAAVGPISLDDDTHDSPTHVDDAFGEDGDAGHGDAGERDGSSAGSGTLPGGLMVSEAGYTLALEDADREATSTDPLRFRVLGPDGAALTTYTTAHGKDLHLIVVRRDMAHYQHVHPRLDADGVWTADDLDLSAAGEYRVFADFVPGGAEDGPTLGADLSVAGRYDPQPLPAAATTARVGEYEVELEGELRPGQESELTLTVTRDGMPVTDLQPYLEAYGHLVALRDGDQAYLHVHPTGAPGDGVTDPGPEISFAVTVPSAGAYRLFLDFRHQGVVRTAEFTAVTPGGSASETADGSGHGNDSAPTESNDQDEPAEAEGDHGH